ncbi:hypothetical protein E2C01_017729 [Portunus trituberculatus]|uniref:Uncharacterized protein n=1 Tax=Portunus trituberculatus TaxID=210409 RepID=A0A5B7DSL6_PORTR|nr:hypothetical protein [Portunus trituberculatus]
MAVFSERLGIETSPSVYVPTITTTTTSTTPTSLITISLRVTTTRTPLRYISSSPSPLRPHLQFTHVWPRFDKFRGHIIYLLVFLKGWDSFPCVEPPSPCLATPPPLSCLQRIHLLVIRCKSPSSPSDDRLASSLCTSASRLSFPYHQMEIRAD